VKFDKSAQHLYPDRALDFILKGSENVVAITLHARIDPGSELSRNGFLASGVHYLHFFFETKETVDRVLSKLPPVDWRNLQIPLRAEDGKYYQDPTTQEPITRPPTLSDGVSVTVGVLTPSRHTGPPPGSRYNTQPSNNTAGRGSRTRPSYEQTDPRATSRQRTDAETDVLAMFAQFQDMQDRQKRDRDRPWYMPNYPPQFVPELFKRTRVISHPSTHPIKSLPPRRTIQFTSCKTVPTGPT